MVSSLTPISYIRKVIYTTYASFTTGGLKPGDLAFATDRLVLYRWNGAAWQAISIHSSSGTAAAIPTAADLPNGSVYYETDTGLLKQVQSGAWASVSQNITSGIIVMWAGTIASIPPGWVICDGNASTPNLLTRFVQGVATAATDPGATGGATAKTTSGHIHTQNDSGPGDSDAADPGLVNHSSAGHTHTNPDVNTNTDSIADIRPKYFDLAFLMKT